MQAKKNAIAVIIGIWLLLILDAQAIEINKVVCVTHKEIYQQGEEVLVTITNYSRDETKIVDRRYIDGGFATIEMRQNDGTWQAIELYAAANIASFRTLQKEESYVYVWKTVGYNRMDTAAIAGAYRILFHNGIISNQFFIKD